MILYVTGSKYWSDYGAAWSALGEAYLAGYRELRFASDTNVGRMVSHIGGRLGFALHPSSTWVGSKAMLVLREKGRGNRECDAETKEADGLRFQVLKVHK